MKLSYVCLLPVLNRTRVWRHSYLNLKPPWHFQIDFKFAMQFLFGPWDVHPREALSTQRWSSRRPLRLYWFYADQNVNLRFYCLCWRFFLGFLKRKLSERTSVHSFWELQCIVNSLSRHLKQTEKTTRRCILPVEKIPPPNATESDWIISTMKIGVSVQKLKQLGKNRSRRGDRISRLVWNNSSWVWTASQRDEGKNWYKHKFSSYASWTWKPAEGPSVRNSNEWQKLSIPFCPHLLQITGKLTNHCPSLH